MRQANKQDKIYKQKQGLVDSTCAIHALNNILGRAQFTKQFFDKVCKDLSEESKSRHKHIFGGDYDINVIEVALVSIGLQMQWIDARKLQEFDFQKQLSNRTVIGYLVNKQVKKNQFQSFLGKITGLSGRHWICLRNIGNNFYKIDSKQSMEPEVIHEMNKYVKIQLEKGSQIIQIFKKQK